MRSVLPNPTVVVKRLRNPEYSSDHQVVIGLVRAFSFPSFGILHCPKKLCKVGEPKPDRILSQSEKGENTLSNVQFDPEHEQDASAEQHTSDQTTITVSSVEKMMASARPRLLRLAHLRGIAPDALDDVVQETLTAAWQRLDHLRSPERFHAWLDGICRNMCLRWHEESALLTRRHIPLAMCSAKELSHDEDHYTEDIPNPRVLDPVEELSQQDLAVLLDHALGYLPNETRKLIELCYFAEMPQREAALHLGMTISALESRLYRARRQLHEVLSGDLRGEAEAFGLAMGGETASGWRETREWCMLCGRHRLRGGRFFISAVPDVPIRSTTTLFSLVECARFVPHSSVY